jgi:hypothetical protein
MKKLIFMAVISVLFLFSCSTIQVMSDYDRTVDFTKYKTYSFYGWKENSDKLLSQLDKERIEKAFAKQFAARGLEYKESGGDLIVSLYIVTKEEQQVNSTTTTTGPMWGGCYYGFGPGWGWGTGFSTTSYHVENYTVGTLICDVYDANEKKLIWEGIAKGTINENPVNRDVTIPKHVARLMSKYPVPPIDEKKK